MRLNDKSTSLGRLVHNDYHRVKYVNSRLSYVVCEEDEDESRG